MVKISGLGAAPDCVIQTGLEHDQVERLANGLVLVCTFLRPSMMMFNLAAESQADTRDGRIHSTAEDGRLSWGHPLDVAAVAAVALTEPGPESKTYHITGSESLSFDDLAERRGRLLMAAIGSHPNQPEAGRDRFLAQ